MRNLRSSHTSHGIEAVVGASPDMPEKVVSAYLSGGLVLGHLLCREAEES